MAEAFRSLYPQKNQNESLVLSIARSFARSGLMRVAGLNLHSFAFLCAFLAFFAVQNKQGNRKARKADAKSRKGKLHQFALKASLTLAAEGPERWASTICYAGIQSFTHLNLL
jgi:hypothetical protein